MVEIVKERNNLEQELKRPDIGVGENPTTF